MGDIKRMSVKEFRELGYLQELNRQFLHPLGLALEVIIDDDGTERFGEVWDERGDPEGWIFGGGMIDAAKARRVRDELLAKLTTRQASLGYAIQPCE